MLRPFRQGQQGLGGLGLLPQPERVGQVAPSAACAAQHCLRRWSQGSGCTEAEPAICTQAADLSWLALAVLHHMTLVKLVPRTPASSRLYSWHSRSSG